MDKATWFFGGVLVGVMIVFALHCFLPCNQSPDSRRAGYRAGQIDAARGVMKYELREQDDGTTSWELKGE